MSKQIRFETPAEHQTAHGIDIHHPLVSLVDFSRITLNKVTIPEEYTFGFYYVAFKESKCGKLKYGCNYYDYDEETLIFLAPNQVIETVPSAFDNPKGKALMFHPDMFRGTSLAKKMKEYTFFSYNINAALQVLHKEKVIKIGQANA